MQSFIYLFVEGERASERAAVQYKKKMYVSVCARYTRPHIELWVNVECLTRNTELFISYIIK